MIAFDSDRTLCHVIGDDLHHALGVGAVANEVAQKCKAFHALFASMRKACVERFQVAVDVGQQADPQHSSFGRETPALSHEYRTVAPGQTDSLSADG